MDNETTKQKHSLQVTLNIEVTQEDIDDIMCSALEGGINYWCHEVEVDGEYLGTYAHEQISRGGVLLLHNDESGQLHHLSLDKFLTGLRLFIKEDCATRISIKNSGIDAGEFDAICADSVVQLAIFGKIIFG